jgi:N-methylhydantoinase A
MAQSESRTTYRLGADIGGTFTDLILLDETAGHVYGLKTPSTHSPEDAVINGILALKDQFGIDPAKIDFFSHGTTLAVNTLLQRNGDPVGALVTKGFRDTLELRRLRLSKPNDFFVPKPVSLVPRRHMREVDERMQADGTPLVEPAKAQVLAEARALWGAGIRNIAVLFLHAFQNDAHERQVAQWVRAELPEAYVCTSAEIWPQQREYERFLISVINAHIGGRMQRYFATLAEKLGRIGVKARVFSTKSNGGVMSLAAAGARPVETLLSGPASGVVGAHHVGEEIGERRLVTLDMGGTSVDISIIDGAIPYAAENTVGDFPVIMPAIDVSAIGAGGGSIAWANAEGMLKVGPESAGAIPGPVCYGRGGTRPTVTDAYVAAGMINPENFLGGTLKLDGDAARTAIADLGERIGLLPLEAAGAILQVATASIYAGLMPQLARRGAEPSDFALFAYGAAGPTHAFLVAREIPFAKVIVPPAPGLLCALGCLVADLRADFVQTVWRDLGSMGDAELCTIYETLETEARTWLARQSVHVTGLTLVRSADLSYVGQSYEVNVPFPADEHLAIANVTRWFHGRHATIYGVSDEAAPARLLEARLQIVGTLPKAEMASVTPAFVPHGETATRRTIFDRGEAIEARVFQRSTLTTGTTLNGPLVIEQYDTTCYVPRGFMITVDATGNLIGMRE